MTAGSSGFVKKGEGLCDCVLARGCVNRQISTAPAIMPVYATVSCLGPGSHFGEDRFVPANSAALAARNGRTVISRAAVFRGERGPFHIFRMR